ncbi:MAG: hypothetical protein AAFN77_20250 [Planctomycetota bacterium]
MLKSIVFMLVGLVSVSLAADEVIPIKKYSGVNRQPGLEKLAPVSGVVVGEAELKKLWDTWGIAEKLPKVDFQKQIVLVAITSGPNRPINGPLRLDNREIKYSVLSTRMGGPGFGYLLMLIDREGIDTVNGKPVPVPVDANAVEDSIVVEVVGTVTTGIMAIGAETTGSIIRSGEVEWELDFQTAQQLAFAKKLGSQKARVRGQLLQISGVEIKTRSIILVSSIVDAKQPNEDFQPPTPPRMAEVSPEQQPVQPGELPNTEPAKRELDPSQFKAYSSIVVNVSSDQRPELRATQTVDALGNVTLEAGGATQKWSVDTVRLKLLHSLVEGTNWKDFPKLNRSSQTNVVDYSILITTPSGTTRIFVDSGAISKQPLIGKIFDLMKNREKNDQGSRN